LINHEVIVLRKKVMETPSKMINPNFKNGVQVASIRAHLARPGFQKSHSIRNPAKMGEKSFSKGSNYGLPYKRKPFNKERDVKSTRRSADDKPKTDSDLIRLNKFMANSGVGSRREADELIKLGLVTVNGEVITEMGHKVKRTDEVRYEGKKLKAENRFIFC
jgi:23S rRNA pseudouridine2605 synthase